jgi:hypothetical protein
MYKDPHFLKPYEEPYTKHKARPLHKNDTYKLRNGSSIFGGRLICINIPPPPKPHDLHLFSFMTIFPSMCFPMHKAQLGALPSTFYFIFKTKIQYTNA